MKYSSLRCIDLWVKHKFNRDFDINIMDKISQSITDGDVMNGLRRDCDFSINKFICYAEYMKPTQMMGKVKTQIFFPSNVSKTNKVRNNKKKMAALKQKNPAVINYGYAEFAELYKLEKTNKVKRKEQIIPHALLKPLFTL